MLKLPLLLVVLLSSTLIQAQDTGAELPVTPNPSLRPSLEAVYQAWRNAISTGNLTEWENSTALSRQFDTRNRIVSQKLPFPHALFEDPVAAPSLSGLIALGVLSTGENGHLHLFWKGRFWRRGDGCCQQYHRASLHS